VQENESARVRVCAKAAAQKKEVPRTETSVYLISCNIYAYVQIIISDTLVDECLALGGTSCNATLAYENEITRANVARLRFAMLWLKNRICAIYVQQRKSIIHDVAADLSPRAPKISNYRFIGNFTGRTMRK